MRRNERGLRDQARASQAGSRSVEDGESVPVYDEAGELRTVAGRQVDGTYTTVDYGGPALEVPSVPVVEEQPGALVVTWDGYDANDEAGWESTFAGVLVHITTAPETELEAETEAHRFTSPDGGSTTFALPADTFYYVTFQSVTTSGVLSGASETVEAKVTPYTSRLFRTPTAVGILNTDETWPTNTWQRVQNLGAYDLDRISYNFLTGIFTFEEEGPYLIVWQLTFGASLAGNRAGRVQIHYLDGTFDDAAQSETTPGGGNTTLQVVVLRYFFAGQGVSVGARQTSRGSLLLGGANGNLANRRTSVNIQRMLG